VSQINGCAHCIEMHSRDLRKDDVDRQDCTSPVWDEVQHLFSDQERAALARAEEEERQPDPRV
jgi:alkylhydroperoxidase family enzyme